jgi:aminopeptidase N
LGIKGVGPEGITDGFELPGSSSNYPPSLDFDINYMSLTIQPKLSARMPTLKKCQEKLDITAKRDIDQVQLDIAEIKVDSVSSTPHLYQRTKTNEIIEKHKTLLKFNDFDKNNPDKLTITLSQTLKKDDSLCILIDYSAGYDAEKGVNKSPRSGFHFITVADRHNKTKSCQAWTQGQMIESRYWFPCLDDPKVKFPRELHVIVPEEYTVISNGILDCKEEYKDSVAMDDIKKIEWVWKESSPLQTYVTSVVIGDFKTKEETYGKATDRNIRLFYHWPAEIERKGYDPKLTFGQTPDLLKFFESYLHTNYPYEKYSQVTVEDFDYGGMENASCTTMPSDLFHDCDALPNYTWDDEVVRHELAHQWFGDSVTCRDWQHIWLNEGFATYFEALYLDQGYINNVDKASSRDDFYYYMLTNIMSSYLAESVEYKRPLVTNIYKHPSDLFDSHSYQKGACVLHMLRNYVEENNFRESLRTYLDRHKDGSVETDDLRRVLEEVSGISLQQFFDQWTCKPGHPTLNADFIIESDGEKRILKIKIKQIKKANAQDNIEELAKDESSEELVHEGEVFVFPIDIKLSFSDFAGLEFTTKTFRFEVLKNVNEFSIDLTQEGIKKLHYISIDPEIKILRDIDSIKFEDKADNIKHTDILKSQVLSGETVIERIEAIRYIEKLPSEDLISLLKKVVLNDPFYGVSSEAANALGSYSRLDDDKYENLKSQAYSALKSFFDKESVSGKAPFSKLDARVKTAVISAFASFNTKESMDEYIYRLTTDKNYFVASQAIRSVGNIASQLSKIEKITLEQEEEKIRFLKSIIQKEFDPHTSSFRNLKARSAIGALTMFADDPHEDIILDIADFLIQCSEYGKDYLLRRDAIPSLGSFLRYKIKQDGKMINKFNDKVFEHLKNVTKSSRFQLQTRACQAIIRKLPDKPDNKLIETMDVLTWLAEHDTDGDVRREAEKSINTIKKRIFSWLQTPTEIEYKIRQQRDKLHERVLQAREARLSLY